MNILEEVSACKSPPDKEARSTEPIHPKRVEIIEIFVSNGVK